MLKALGFYKEFKADNISGDSILDAQRPAGDVDEQLLLTYLAAGHVLLDVMEVRRDVLDGAEQGRSGSLVTDGAWIWREDLVHYVQKYHVRLPEAFLQHARLLAFAVPDLTEESLRALMDDARSALAL